jgi:hypothetical protein
MVSRSRHPRSGRHRSEAGTDSFDVAARWRRRLHQSPMVRPLAQTKIPIQPAVMAAAAPRNTISTSRPLPALGLVERSCSIRLRLFGICNLSLPQKSITTEANCTLGALPHQCREGPLVPRCENFFNGTVAAGAPRGARLPERTSIARPWTVSVRVMCPTVGGTVMCPTVGGGNCPPLAWPGTHPAARLPMYDARDGVQTSSAARRRNDGDWRDERSPSSPLRAALQTLSCLLRRQDSAQRAHELLPLAGRRVSALRGLP